MGQLALETGHLSQPEFNEDIWLEERNAGLVELAERREHGVDLKLLWKKVGDLVMLGAATDSGEKVITLIPNEEAMESLQHPAQYFSHEASDRLFGKAA